MKKEVCMCDKSMKQKNCRLHGGVRNNKMHKLINHNVSKKAKISTNLSGQLK